MTRRGRPSSGRLRPVRRSIWLSLLLTLACGPGAPGEGSSTTSAADSIGEASQTSTQPTTTSDASGTTIASDGTVITGTTNASDGPATTGTTTGIPADTTTTEQPPPPCVPETDWNEPHFDCLIDWPVTTKLQGVGPAASLGAVTKIFFGVRDEACIDGLSLEVPLAVGDPVTPAAVLYSIVAECGPEQWPGTYDLQGFLTDDSTFSTIMKIDGYLGDWQSPDPVDPPRIFGTLSGDLVGTFEAVHCATIDMFFNNCG